MCRTMDAAALGHYGSSVNDAAVWCLISPPGPGNHVSLTPHIIVCVTHNFYTKNVFFSFLQGVQVMVPDPTDTWIEA